jgi:hypothetical protein
LERELKQRGQLIVRILQLGGKIPPPWPHDDTGQFRNLQLLELVEELEEKKHDPDQGV